MENMGVDLQKPDIIVILSHQSPTPVEFPPFKI
jgi:hypothetical protein